jgi:hypothetical protein
MLSLETVPRLEAASRQFFEVLVLVSALKALVLVLRVTVSVLVHSVSLTSRGFDSLTLVSFDNNVKVRRLYVGGREQWRQGQPSTWAVAIGCTSTTGRPLSVGVAPRSFIN